MEDLCVLLVSFDNAHLEKKERETSLSLFQVERFSGMLKTSSEYKINKQTILKEHIDEHYEPTEEEIREYASYIGIDPEKVNKEKINLQCFFQKNQ